VSVAAVHARAAVGEADLSEYQESYADATDLHMIPAPRAYRPRRGGDGEPRSGRSGPVSDCDVRRSSLSAHPSGMSRSLV
jgi:hypothetical protein